MRLSGYFITPEVNLSFFPEALTHTLYRVIERQGIIPGNDVGRQGSPINNKKRAREDGSPGPSRCRPNIKREKLSGDARARRMRALQVSHGVVCFPRVAPDGAFMQAELYALKVAEQSSTSVKRELRSPSPTVVRNAGEVVDLTLDD